MPAAGVATSGKTGALALKSLETGGTLKYIPISNFSPGITRGDDLVMLINNAAYAANKVTGTTIANFSFNAPLIPAILNADFFTRAFGSVSGDTSASNYHTLTMYPDNAGSTAEVYGLCKFGSLAGRVQFSLSGAAQAIGLAMRGMSIDPLSGSVVALAAPSAGAISTGGIKGFAQTTMTGASEVVDVSFNVGTGLQVVPGKRAGTNANFPQLAAGLLMTDLAGTVTMTQFRNATTFLGADGSDGTLVLSIGSTGSGVSMTFKLMPMSLARPSSMGINFVTSTYGLKSIDGTTSPFVIADL